MRLQIQIWTKRNWKISRLYLSGVVVDDQAWSEWRHWQNLKRCFCGKWQNLAQTLKLDVKGIELRTPNVQEDKKISRG